MPIVEGVENDYGGVTLLTGDEAISDAVLSTAATLGVSVQSHDGRAGGLLRLWSAAGVLLVGGDMVAAVAALGPPRRPRVYLVGFEGDSLAGWSVPLSAEVIPLPRGAAWLSAVLSADATVGCPVVAVVGGSGGVGASTVAAGLAFAARRRGSASVLVDVDPVGGGIDLLLGAERTPGWRWPKLAGARGEVGDLRGFLPEVDGVGVVSMARSGPDVSATPPGAEVLQAVVGSLGRHHDLVVIDAGRFPAPESRHQVRAADVTLVVTGSSVRAVAAASETRRLLDLESAPVVLRQQRGAGAAASQVAELLDARVMGSVPTEPRLARLAEEGRRPVLNRRTKWSRSMEALLASTLDVAGRDDRP